jgi:acetyl esterase/lipase
MRGIVAEKLKPFLEQANIALNEAQQTGLVYTPKIVRENIEKLAVYIGDAPELSYYHETELVTKSHTIAARVYSPAPTQKLPVVLHYHGGGHMCGNIALYDTISRKIALSGHCVVIAVEYRLAPEYPYPAGIDDCVYALANYQQVLKGLNYNDQVYIVGDSGGGAICSTLASLSLVNKTLKIDKQILIYPSVDYTMSCPSIEENGNGFLLEKDKIAWYFQHYFTHNEPVQSASPLFMPMLSTIGKKMPSTLVITAGCDPLRDEGIAYANALAEKGVEVKHHLFKEMIHAYMLLDALVADECQQTYQLIGDFIKD